MPPERDVFGCEPPDDRPQVGAVELCRRGGTLTALAAVAVLPTVAVVLLTGWREVAPVVG